MFHVLCSLFFVLCSFDFAQDAILLIFILVRVFEDNDLISVNLYDGGLKKNLTHRLVWRLLGIAVESLWIMQAKFRSVLNTRCEVENGRIRWFDLWWPREQKIFESEKLVTSCRAKENTFAYENKGTYPQPDITLITPKEDTLENLKYLLALLNSSCLNNWYGSNTKKKGNIRREFWKLLFLRYTLSLKCSFTKVNSAFSSIASLEKSNFQNPFREYYFTPMSKIPIRKIDSDNPDDVKIHSVLGEIYTTQPADDDGFIFDKVTPHLHS